MEQSTKPADSTSNGSKMARNGGGCLRLGIYLSLILVFAAIAFAVFTGAMALRQTQDTVAPIGDFVRNLVIPATAVVLPDPVTIVNEVKDLARLETISHSYEKVIRAERGDDALWGAFSETLIFVAHGEVIAGVDLAQMQEGDIQVVDPVTVMVHLPDAEIFNTVVDNERSYVADRDTGLFVSADPQLESQVRLAAQQELEAAALEAGILLTADANAEAYMRTFLQELGFENIIFTDSTPPTPPPFEQDVPKGYAVTPAP